MNIQEEMLSFPSRDPILVGLESRLVDLNSYMDVGLKDVRFVGICGMGGIGKTTLARAYFNMMSHQFDGMVFLANVREVSSKRPGLLSLQEKLVSQIVKETKVKIWNVYNGMDLIKRRLRNKRVLIVLDDVDQLNQLQHLAGRTDWFGLGSRIIITSRDQHLLMSHGVDRIYNAKILDDISALQLLSLKSFNNICPPEEYMKLSTNIVQHVAGLPLAIEVLGSFLFGKALDEWQSVLDRMKENNPEKRIFDTLKISFDGLEETEKQIFLDIACFFKGKKKDGVTRILESCDFYPEIGIRVLIDKSLITIDDAGKFIMHDLLQEMGWQIVRQESRNDPGKRTRIWLYEDMFKVCETNTGTEDVVGIVLDLPEVKEALCAEAFVKLKKLRLLKLRNVHFSSNLEHLSNELRFLEWHGYPFENFPSTFQAKKLVEMNMCHSQAKQLWEGIKQFNKLKIIELSHSENLEKTPHFRGVQNLEKLILEGCIELKEIDESIGCLHRLVLLNLKDCKKLESVPENIYGLKALKVLNLSGCLKLDYMMEGLECLECLEELDLSLTVMKRPSAFVSLSKNLEILSISGCKEQLFLTTARKRPHLSSLPGWGFDFCPLKSLDLSNCALSEEFLPKEFSCLSSLSELSLNGNSFKSLPVSINALPILQLLYLDDCKMLQSLQALPSNLEFVTAQGCTSLETLPDLLQLYRFRSFRLNLSNCFNLVDNHGQYSFVFTMLRKYLQLQVVCLSGDSEDQSSLGVPSNPTFCLRPKFDFVVPGSEIPDWFSYQCLQSPGTYASTISIPLSSAWMGIAICCVFVIGARGTSCFYDLALDCEIEMMNHTWRNSLDDRHLSIKQSLGSDHLWLFYVSRYDLFHNKSFQDTIKPSTHLKVCVYRHGIQMLVKKFGVCVVHEQDVLDSGPPMDQI